MNVFPDREIPHGYGLRQSSAAFSSAMRKRQRTGAVHDAVAHSSALPRFARQRLRAFTMVEIALCLAIIGFALVAIISVLPRGMEVQQVNREETIINQDATIWLTALKNGARGYDDLTNYVIAITNYWTVYTVAQGRMNVQSSGTDWHMRNGAATQSGLPDHRLITGSNIIGLLSAPKLNPQIIPESGTVRSNHITAYVRAMSGPSIERPPQTNEDFLQNALTYRLLVENWSMPVYMPDTNVAANLEANTHELRLLFRYPIFPTGKVGPRRMSFRALADGTITEAYPGLFYLRPSTYVQIP